MKDISKKLEESLKLIQKIGKEDNIEYVFPHENSFSINWNEIIKLSNRGDCFAGGMLIDLEILDWNTKGNYDLIYHGISVNPFCVPPAFFKREEDAAEYRKALMSDAKANSRKLVSIGFPPIHIVKYLD